MYRVSSFGQFINWLRRTMVWSGSSTLASLSLVGYALYIAAILIGMPLTVFKLDAGKSMDQVHGGYTCLLGIGVAFTVSFVLGVTSTLPALIASIALSILQGMMLSIIKPSAKKM